METTETMKILIYLCLDTVLFTPHCPALSIFQDKIIRLNYEAQRGCFHYNALQFETKHFTSYKTD